MPPTHNAEYTYEQMAKEITIAQSHLRSMTPNEVASYYVTVLNALQQTETDVTVSQAPVQLPLPEKTTVQPTTDTERVTASLIANPDFITCLECGQHLQMLTTPHLAKHNGLTQQTYKEKWGIDQKTKLVCQALLEQRRLAMDENRIWKHRKFVKKMATPQSKKTL